jgi:hypothetical protein
MELFSLILRDRITVFEDQLAIQSLRERACCQRQAWNLFAVLAVRTYLRSPTCHQLFYIVYKTELITHTKAP